MRCPILVVSLVFACIAASYAQQNSVTQKEVVHVGIAPPFNQSSFAISDKWGRDQIIQNLKALRNDRKSAIVIETVSLGSSQKDAALQEGAEKHCDYVVLTRIVNFSNRGGIMVGPSGAEPMATMPGNVNAKTWMGMDFSIMRPGHPKPVAEGRSAAPTETPSAAAQSENAAMEDAARQIALRIANEIRTQTPTID